MRLPALSRRRLNTLLGWMATVGFVVGTVLVYRWAEPLPPTPTPVQNVLPSSNVTMRLENAPFIGHSNGFKTWSLQAGQIALERMPGSSLASIENVSLTDIKDGLLFPEPPAPVASPATVPAGPGSSARTALDQLPPEKEVAYGPWTAKFRAGHGHYHSGLLALPPPELALLYRLQSEFDLTQSVDFRTREGDHFEAESLTVFDLISKKSGHSERRILCDNGMKITHKDAQMTANQARYDVSERTVECLGGARATFPDGALQSERMYWSLNAGMLRCPDTVTGTLQGVPFTAQGLTVDIKNRSTHANHITFQLRSDSLEKLQSLETKTKGKGKQ